MTLHRILCPVDFSEPSRRALRHALAIARWHEAEVSVLHVEDVLLTAASVEAGGYTGLAERHEQELHELLDDAGGKNQRVRVHIASGGAVSGILEHATRQASDLIVMGTNGRSGLARAVLGSITEGVVRQASIPVLTIPPAMGEHDFAELIPFDTILCASDFSPACKKALELSIVMGQEADARLILLHALQLPELHLGVAPMPLPLTPRIDVSELRKDALARLKRGLPADAVFRCRPEAIVAEGPPADAILETAYREDAKLIVIGVQARGALDRLLFGSTTRDVTHAALCPVLSIRADGRSEPWPASPAAEREGAMAPATHS